MNGFFAMDTVHFRYVVLRNLYDCLAQLIGLAEEMNIPFPEEQTVFCFIIFGFYDRILGICGDVHKVPHPRLWIHADYSARHEGSNQLSMQ